MKPYARYPGHGVAELHQPLGGTEGGNTTAASQAVFAGVARYRTMRLASAIQAVLKAELVEADKRVMWGRSHIALQRRLLDHLQRGGHETALAASLLQTFIDSQSLHEAGAARLRDEFERWCEVERAGG